MSERMKYKCLLSDPPWDAERGGGGRGCQNHYPTMSVENIIRTMQGWLYGDLFRPKSIVDEAGCHLWLWCTDQTLPDGLRIIEALKFRYVCCWEWVKLAKVEVRKAVQVQEPGIYGIAQDLCAAEVSQSLQLGLGQYSRKCHEHLLLGTRGNAMVPEPESRPPSVIFAPRTRHSEKPPESYEVIETVSPGPRLEMFARRRREGWDALGNEV